VKSQQGTEDISRLVRPIELLSDGSDAEEESISDFARDLLESSAASGVQTRNAARRKAPERPLSRRDPKRPRLDEDAGNDDTSGFAQTNLPASKATTSRFPPSTSRQQSTVMAAQREELTFDPDYDVTPAADGNRGRVQSRESTVSYPREQEGLHTGFLKRFAAQQESSAREPTCGQTSTRPANVSAIGTEQAPFKETPPLGQQQATTNNQARIRAWVKVRNDTGRSAVVLDRAMNVQAAFGLCQQKLSRKLNGKPIVALRCFMIDQKTIEDTDVEQDDEDTWEALLEKIPPEENGRLPEVQAWVEV